MSPQPCYRVGIDLGTTYSAAAVLRAGEARPEVLALGEQSAAVPSMVFLAPDGTLLCGEAAQRRAVTEPRRVVREFKRRIGDSTPLVVGGAPVAAEAVAARFVGWMLDRVAEREGGSAERVALTHPAEWGPHKRESIIAALAERGIADVLLLTEPEAAAVGYASTERVDVGATVAVYDLGGGTFDAAVVRKLPDGRFEVVGKPVGIERLGGVDFDETVLEHVRSAVGDAWLRLDPTCGTVQSAVAGLRRECTAAKEALSVDTEVQIPVMLPGLHTQVRLGRAEFEDRIRPAVADTVEALRRALQAAGTTAADLDAVLMVGGSSRIPLITQLVSVELGRAVSVDADPKSVIATGAAIAAAGTVAARVAAAPAPISRTPIAPVPADDRPTAVIPPRPQRSATGLTLPPATPVAPTGERWRGRTLTMIVGAGLAASLVSGVAVLAFAETDAGASPRPATDRLTADEAVASATVAVPDPTPAGVDPWTGQAPADTTVAGPRRPAAAAAAARPRVRTVPTGSAGASPSGSGAVAGSIPTAAPDASGRGPDPTPDADGGSDDPGNDDAAGNDPGNDDPSDDVDAPDQDGDTPTDGDSDEDSDGDTGGGDGDTEATDPDGDTPDDGPGTVGEDPGAGSGSGSDPTGPGSGTPTDPGSGGALAGVTVAGVGPPAGSGGG